MNNKYMDVYSVQEKDEFFATRSELFNIEPIGIGTPYVESLSSYISRLAMLHQVRVSVLLKYIISPYLTINHIKKELKVGITKGISSMINDLNNVTLELVNAFEKATGRKDLINLTMLNWKGIFSGGIRSEKRKWCPECLEIWKKEGKEIYEPLIWYLKDIEICDIHQIKLVEDCPCCHRKLPFLHSRYKVGYCQYCGKWLGNKGICETQYEKNQLTRVFEYKKLLQSTPYLESVPTRLHLGEVLKLTIEEKDLKSKRRLAQYLGFSPPTIFEWINNKYLPKRKSLFIIITKFNCSLYDLIYTPKISINIDDASQDNISKIAALSWVEVKKILLSELNSNNSDSMYQISGKYKFNCIASKNRFPDLYEKIQKKHVENISYLLTEYLNKDIPVSLEQISKDLQYSPKILRTRCPQLCATLVTIYKLSLASH